MGYLSKLGAGTIEQLIRGDQTPTPAPAAVRTSAPAEPAGAVPAVQAPQASTVTAAADASPALAKPRADQNVPQADAPPAPIPLDVPDDAAARQAHEAAEARRKAEWDARQSRKNAARQAELDKLAAMSDAEVIQASTKRVGDDTEKLTRRSMKEAVCEHVQTLCRQNAAFARRAMAPEKSMVNCFQYINRKAQEYAEQEMKDNGVARTGIYGLDVPDGLCYQWAEDYFNDPDAKEDHKDDEKFTPKPYVPPTRKTSKTKAAKGKPEKKKPVAEKPKSAAGSLEQMSLL